MPPDLSALTDPRVLAVLGVPAVAALAAGAWAAWQRVGTPLVRFELVRLARGGQQPLLRGLVAVVTLAGLFATYLRAGRGLDWRELLAGGGTLPANRMADFGEAFLLAFLAVQLAAVVLAAPVVMGSGIAAEKEAGTLDGLLTTGMSAQEVVVGKFLARLVYVAGVAAAGVPALVMATLFGGVDLPTLAGGTVVVFGGAASLGAGTVLAASRREGLREALTATYGWLAGLSLAGTCCGCVPGLAVLSPVSALVWLLAARGAMPDEWVWGSVAGYAVVHAVFTVGCLQRAAEVLTADKPVRLPAPDPVAVDDLFPEPVPVYGVEPLAPRRPRESLSRVPDGDAAFAWKERTFPGRARRHHGTADFAESTGAALLLGIGVVAGAVLLAVLAKDAGTRPWAGDAFTPVLKLLLSAAAVALPLFAGVRAAGSVARERERGTLDALLTLPARRTDILRAKFRAAFGPARTPAKLVGGFAAVSLCVGGVFPVGLLTAGLTVAALTVAAGAVGLWLSVAARTVTRATLGLMLAVFAAWVVPPAVTPVVGAALDAAGVRHSAEWASAVAAASPPAGAWRATVGWPMLATPEWEDFDAPAQLGNLASAAGLGLLAAVAWRAADRRFERLGR